MVNPKPHKLGKNTRMSFAKIDEALEMPNLIEVQKKSYQWFLDEGLREVLRDVSPITDSTGNLSIDFLDYTLDTANPKYPVEECKERDVNYAAPLRVRVRLHNKATGELAEKDIFMGDFPLMTDNGTFVINGSERVIVSQIVRSPGIYFGSDRDKTGKKIYTSTVIPYRGAWLEYETDANDIFYVRIDKNRKIPVTVLIRALGFGEKDATDEVIKEAFGDSPMVLATLEADTCSGEAEKYKTRVTDEALKEIFRKLRPTEIPGVEPARTLINNLFFDPRRYDLANVGRYKFDKKLSLAYRIAGLTLSRDVFSPFGELLASAGETISQEMAENFERNCVNEVYVVVAHAERNCKLEEVVIDETVLSHTVIDETSHEQLAAEGTVLTGELVKELRAHGISTVHIRTSAEVKVFSNGTVYPAYVLGYDLKDSGINGKVRLSVLQEIIDAAGGIDNADEIRRMARIRMAELAPKHITKDDIFSSINYLLCLTNDIGNVDDIDHLGNRRLRSVGELLQNQVRIGFSRMDKIVKERMMLQDSKGRIDDEEEGEEGEDGDSKKLSPEDLINIRPVVTAIREFFGSSPLSQFMDQNNPLAELTHKRRLSALGPGGLSRDRASFDVRDVHYTHYGRMCPIETPEGPNIGLISYLATYARISEYGFIETPYRKIDKATGIVTDQVEYMTADVEDNYIIAQANEPLDENNRFVNKKVIVRQRAEIKEVDNRVPDYMDVSPKMVVSVATAMIPFLENDDNSRALMGSNMQKQAVPLLVNDSPIVGTGMEYKAAIDSGVVVCAKEAGTVERVSADEIIIRDDEGRKTVYRLVKFKRSNQSTCINQRPIVDAGEYVAKGQVIADGPATCGGEISLGKNALIGFMTWEGYNYEDAVLLNENLVRNDVYTSIHIEEYTHEARDTKLGPEEITREIPNVGDDNLKDLSADGIIRKGTEVRAGDILVGKVTPKGETELTAEERLLRAIFGEKAREVRDTSLRVPHGASGIVVDVRVFSREDGDELPAGVNKVVHVYIAQKRKISVGDKMAGRHGNKGVVSRILPPEDMPFMADGTPLDIVLNPMGVPSRMNIGQVLEVHLGIAARKLGWKVMTPVFDGAKESDISELLERAGMSRTGKMTLYDGRTGEPFDNPVTVGIMYYLKLHHLVDDKIHARSTGPYSLVTQQPLGGKAQFGGQRFGEMEVWALEAYGAAYTLQEILTVKSDDVTGRVKTYEAIVKGQNIPTPSVPEAFKVLVKELQSLCLNINVMDDEGNVIDLSVIGDDTDDTPRRKGDESISENDIGKAMETDEIRDGMITGYADENGDLREDDDGYDEEDDYGDEDDDSGFYRDAENGSLDDDAYDDYNGED